MTTKQAKALKGRILFLHGYTQSSSIFYAKTSALRKKLKKMDYLPVYLEGPLKLTPADLSSIDSFSKFSSVGSTEEDATNYRSWWTKKSTNNNEIDLTDAIKCINDYIKDGKIISENEENKQVSKEEMDLPIVGVVGFSQGAALGGLIIHKFKELFGVDTLKFSVLYAGFKLDTSSNSGNEKYADYYPPSKDTGCVKLLHVYGELDTVVDETRILSLYEATKSSSDILKHPGGHFVPNSKPMVDQVTNWIHNANSSPVEEKKDENDLDSLMDMIDNLGKA